MTYLINLFSGVLIVSSLGSIVVLLSWAERPHPLAWLIPPALLIAGFAAVLLKLI